MGVLSVLSMTSVSSGHRVTYSDGPIRHRSPCLPSCSGTGQTAAYSSGSSDDRQCRRQVLQTGAAALMMHMTALANAADAATSSSNSTQQVTSQYDSYAAVAWCGNLTESLHAAQYDQLDSGAAAEIFGIPRLRQDLVGAAHGQVLEVALGMLQQAQSKLSQEGQGLQVSLQQGNVEALPFDANSFDCVVDTFSLCVFPEPLKALREMARVLNPDGKLLLLEHSRSTHPLLGWYQDITKPAVAALGKGCKWNQDVTDLLTQAGLRPTKLRTSLAGVITLVEAEKL